MSKGNNSQKMHVARRAKKDEFYTQLSDISNELKHYSGHFEGKVVYCNCDDPYESNFFQYFVMNFRRLGIKKLITTCYDGSPVAGKQLELPFLEDEHKLGPGKKKRVAHKIVITSVKEFYHPETGFDLDDIKNALRNGEKEARLEKLKGNGDFRSEECVELLREADIVVTNPPFSLFRKYLAQLVKYEKKFLIIGNQNAINCKEIFPLVKKNKMWLGFGFERGNAYFATPHADDYGDGVLMSDGLVKFRNCCWYTNLDHNKRHYPIILYKKYSAKEFPKYDNYDAIDVSKTAEIPEDYEGVMGVPITFLDKYCPEQFEIVGLGNGREHFTPTKDYISPIQHKKDGTTTNGGKINLVLALATKKKPPLGTVYYTSDNSDYLISPYSRILIRKKQKS